MNAPKADVWDDAIRRHDRRVYLSLLSLGQPPERARELAQQTWTRLMEQQANGALAQLDLPGLAIRQARFLALNDFQRTKVEKRALAAVPAPLPEPAVDRVIESRQRLEQVLDALAQCTPTARKVFRIVYATADGNAAVAAQALGLSLQRVRQILCETRNHIRRVMEGQP